jgi:alkyl sulfatase BDS1-like metallo-beta-lactamase superfamily hydrolase
MKKKLIMGLLATLVIITLVAIPILAVDFTIPSRSQPDTSFPGKIPDGIAESQSSQADAERFPFVWWRDTSAQNALWSHSAEQFANTIIQAYVGANCRVLVFSSQFGSNVVAITGPQGNTIIGAGGSRNGAKIALGAFEKAVPNFAKNLRAIIYTDCKAQTVWGGNEFITAWSKAWEGEPEPHPSSPMIYAHANINDAGALRQAVSTAVVQDNMYVYGPELGYGPDANLGIGSSFSFNPYQIDQGLEQPNRWIVSETTVMLGGVSMRLIPSPAASIDAGLAVFLPNDDVLIVGEIFGKYFPPIDGITAPEIPALKWTTTLDNWKNLNANVLASLHALPITGLANITDVLINQKNALLSVHSQTVTGINQMRTLDDLVNWVKLPASIASHPWVQEYTGTVAGAVKSIYHQYMGWFDWQVDSLTNFSTFEEAAFLVELAGGPAPALKEAYKFEQDHTLGGAQRALVISNALRKAAPSHEADLIYVQSLKKIGYAQTSGEMRNYYLLLAKRAEATMQ